MVKKANVIRKMNVAKSTRQAKKSGIDGLINGIPIRKLYVAPTGKSKVRNDEE